MSDTNLILEKVKLSLRVVTDDFDEEITDLISAAQSDLMAAGVVPEPIDNFVLMAIKTYCRANFGNPENYDKLKASYDEQKAQLSTRTGYTKWVNG